MSAQESQNSKRYMKERAPRALATCQLVAQRALKAGLDPVEIVAISWKESRHTRGLVGGAGEVGPLQAIPKYWARKRDKDHITAGLRAWAYYRKKSATPQEAAGKYNGGGTSSRYAQSVGDLIKGLKLLVQVARWPAL